MPESKEIISELESLLSLVASGCVNSFEQLYRKSYNPLFCFAQKLLQEAELCHDLLQDCYLQIWLKASQFDASRGKAISWMFTIVKNRAINQLNQCRYTPLSMSSNEHCDNLPARYSEQPEEILALKETIEKQLNQLQPMGNISQRILLLAWYYGYRREEIAIQLNLPINTVKSKLRRSLQALQN